MGAENSVLENCEWGDPLVCSPLFPWQLTPVVKPDGNTVSVFEPKNSEKKDANLLKKAAVILRGIRHPNILRFVGYGESSDGFWLATDHVTPLVSALPLMSYEELCIGLHDIMQGLEFLHSVLGMSHNNLCLSSIFVAFDGVWKLGGLEHACKFQEATQDFLDKSRAFRHESSLAPEEKSNSVQVDTTLGHARDVFAFGVLVDDLMDLVEDKAEGSSMLQQLSACVSSDPASRPRVSHLERLEIFQSDMLEIVSFLKNIPLKSDPERKLFFSNLLSRLQKLPETAVARRLVVPLLSRFVVLDKWADQMILPHLLLPKQARTDHDPGPGESAGLLTPELFQQYVTDHLYNMFHVHDCHVRLVLLEHFSNYVHLFSRAQLEDDIFIQILLGLRDTDDRIVAASLRALADLVPILGGNVVIGGSRKTYFFHGIPKQVSTKDMNLLNTPHSVTAAMSSRKPLLKDLAAGSRNSLLLSGGNEQSQEKERKAKEREARREESKRKRELRRKQLKQKQQETDQAEHSSLQNGFTIEQLADADSIDDDALNKDQKNSLYVQDKNEDEGKVLSNKGSDDEANDWLGWDNIDDHIADEIEAELANMASTVTVDTKVQTSPSPYRSQSPPSPPPVKVDNSEVCDKELGGVFQGVNNQRGLYEESAVEDKVTGSSQTVGSYHTETGIPSPSRPAEGFSQTQSSSSLLNGKSLKLKSSTEVRPQVKKTRTKSASLDDLGFGYDIKSIEIVANSAQEIDFFSDMAPSLSQSYATEPILSEVISDTRSKKSLSSTGAETEVTTNISSTDGSIKMFAVASVLEENAVGWSDEDDLDWGNTDF